MKERLATAWRRLRRSPPPQTDASLTAADRMLLDVTGKDSVYWVGWIQDYIVKWFEQEPDNPHPRCYPERWISDLAVAVVRCAEAREVHGDENMGAAYVVSLILATWWSRLAHTKAYDPRRPIHLRRQALTIHAYGQSTLVAAILDERHDPEMFKLPHWDNPYDPEATDGDFV